MTKTNTKLYLNVLAIYYNIYFLFFNLETFIVGNN